MNSKGVILFAALLFSASALRADTITLSLGQSNESYSLIGNGGSNGYGTYLAQQGTCSAGATTTVCSLTGSYTGSDPGYASGGYTLFTTYDNADGGIAATSSTQVAADGGNYFIFDPLSADLQMTLLLNSTSGLNVVPLVVNGQFVADSFFIHATNSICNNLPVGVSCTQGDVGLHTGDSISSPITAGVIFETASNGATPSFLPASTLDAPAVPEPEWLALGGMFPGLVVMLRRRFAR